VSTVVLLISLSIRPDKYRRWSIDQMRHRRSCAFSVECDHLLRRRKGTWSPTSGARRQERAIAYERFFFFVTDVIAPSHAAFFLRRQNAVEAPGLLDERMLAALSAAERYVTRSSFMAGDSFSLADIVAFTIASFVKERLPWD
jgi:glutathione S-transferase